MAGIEGSPEHTGATPADPADARAAANGRPRAYARPPVLTARALVLLIPGTITLVLLVMASSQLWTFMIGALYMVAVYSARASWRRSPRSCSRSSSRGHWSASSPRSSRHSRISSSSW